MSSEGCLPTLYLLYTGPVPVRAFLTCSMPALYLSIHALFLLCTCSLPSLDLALYLLNTLLYTLFYTSSTPARYLLVTCSLPALHLLCTLLYTLLAASALATL